MGKRQLVALLNLFSWCLMIAVLLFLTMPQVCLQLVIVVFPDHTHYFRIFSAVILGNLTKSNILSSLKQEILILMQFMPRCGFFQKVKLFSQILYKKLDDLEEN